MTGTKIDIKKWNAEQEAFDAARIALLVKARNERMEQIIAEAIRTGSSAALVCEGQHLLDAQPVNPLTRLRAATETFGTHVRSLTATLASWPDLPAAAQKDESYAAPGTRAGQMQDATLFAKETGARLPGNPRRDLTDRQRETKKAKRKAQKRARKRQR